MMSPFPAAPHPADTADDPDGDRWPDAGLERRLRAHYATRFGPDPQPDAVWQRLQPRLTHGGRHPLPARAGPAGWPLAAGRVLARRRWPLAVGAAAAVLAVAVAAPLWSRPAPVSAEALLARAQGAGDGAGVRSYHLQATLTEGAGQGATSIEEWSAGEGRMRRQATRRDAAGAVVAETGTGADGARSWRYVTAQGQTRVMLWDQEAKGQPAAKAGGGVQPVPPEKRQALAAGGTPGPSASPPAPAAAARAETDAGELAGLLADLGGKVCGPAQVQGEATVAGRVAYVISLTPQPDGCPGGRGPLPFARATFWLDKETLRELRTELFALDGALRSRYEVTRLELNVAVPDSTFVYTPPPGATVLTVTPNTPPDEVKRFMDLLPPGLK
jgi:hypothetical protein